MLFVSLAGVWHPVPCIKLVSHFTNYIGEVIFIILKCVCCKSGYGTPVAAVEFDRNLSAFPLAERTEQSFFTFC